jgi:hypothetical protein
VARRDAFVVCCVLCVVWCCCNDALCCCCCCCCLLWLLLPLSAAAIEHYAGHVEYDARTFVDKNKDSMWLDLTELWEGSSSALMKTIYVEESTGSRSQSLQFRSQVC